MTKRTAFVLTGILLLFINKINCNADVFGTLVEKTASAQEEAKKAISHADPKAVKNIQRSLAPFKENLEKMDRVIDNEATKRDGKPLELCKHAREALRVAVMGINEAMGLNLKMTRSGGGDLGQFSKFLDHIKEGLEFGAAGAKEFVEAIKTNGDDGVDRAEEIANSYVVAAESLAKIVAELGR